MNTARITRLSTILIAGLVALTGCSGSTSTSQDASDPASTSPSAAEQSAVTEEVGYIDQTVTSEGKPHKDSYSKLVGKPHWAVYQTGAGIDADTEAEITKKADAFLREHVLRDDRWATDWMVQPGELDVYADKTTPALAKSVTEDVIAADALFAE